MRPLGILREYSLAAWIALKTWKAIGRVFVCLQTYQKVVFIKEAITEDVANNMIALSLYLDSVDNKRIYYWLNCPGGEVWHLTSAFAPPLLPAHTPAPTLEHHTAHACTCWMLSLYPLLSPAA